MTLHTWLLYLSFVFVATATPGPAVFFIMHKAGLYGWKKVVFSALGNIIGLFLLGTAAVTGLGALLATSETLFTIVRTAGAAYLVYLGLAQFFKSPGDPSAQLTHQGRESGFKIFLQALGVAVSNPKAIVFLTALFPQFLTTDQSLIPQFTALILTLMGFSFAFLMGYALLAHQAGAWLSHPGRRRWLNRASGSLFVGFGIALGASPRQ